MSEEVIEYEYIYIQKDGTLPKEEDKLIVKMSEGEAEYVNNFLEKQNSEFRYKLIDNKKC